MKKFIPMMLIICLLLSSTKALAAEIDPYEKILNEINIEYNLELEYVKVDSNKISVNEYERIVKKLAISQKETIEYINRRIKGNKENLLSSSLKSNDFISRAAASYSVTSTKIASGYGSATITANYLKNPNTGTIGNASNVSSYVETGTHTYSYIQKSWSSISLDRGETLGITTQGAMVFAGISIANVTLYAEFYY